MNVVGEPFRHPCTNVAGPVVVPTHEFERTFSVPPGTLPSTTMNAALGWWWADPLAGFVIVFYGLKEGWEALHHQPGA